MTEQEQVIAFNIEDTLVSNGTMDEATAKQYAATCIERAQAYEAKIKTMQMPLYLDVWVKEMEARTGKVRIKAHHNLLPWLAAFLVSRYGEAVEHWPDTVTERDVQRAREWKLNGLPGGFVA